MDTFMNLNHREDLIHVRTPVKKSMQSIKSEIKTADSQIGVKSTIEDIAVDELFENFSKIINLSQNDPEEDQEYKISKKLDYENIQGKKLNFDHESFSMKKEKVKIIEKSQGILVSQVPSILSDEQPLLIPNIKSDYVFSTPTKKPSLRGVDKTAEKDDKFRDQGCKTKQFN